MAQVISKDEVIIDDRVTINIKVQKKLTSESVIDEQPSEDFKENPSDPPVEPPGEVGDLQVPEINDEGEQRIEDTPSTPRSTPNSNDDLLQQQAADMIEQVISAASHKVEIELPELLTENILQLNRNHSSEKLEVNVEAEVEHEAEPEVEPEAEDQSLSAATSTETVVETSTTKGILNSSESTVYDNLMTIGTNKDR